MLSICEPDKLDASFCRHVIILNSISFLINFIVQFAYSVRFSHHWKATQHFYRIGTTIRCGNISSGL